MLTWGRESIRSPSTAIVELVKNSYDAGASVAIVQIFSKSSDRREIRVLDNGEGMNERDIDDSWLCLGYSAKRRERKTKAGRRKTGEKGVGRISADRLGASLELRSKKSRSPAIWLRVDWSMFETSGKTLGEIDVAWSSGADIAPSPLPDSLRQHQRSTGSELIITALRDPWSESEIAELRRELSALTSPFVDLGGFEVHVISDVSPGENGPVASPFHHSAVVDGEFSIDDGGGIKWSLTSP